MKILSQKWNLRKFENSRVSGLGCVRSPDQIFEIVLVRFFGSVGARRCTGWEYGTFEGPLVVRNGYII
jgi:hypothetical protein